MDQSLWKKGMKYFWIGFIIEIVGYGLKEAGEVKGQDVVVIPMLMSIIATPFYVVAGINAAKAKGYSGFLGGVLGLLHFIGIAIISFSKNKQIQEPPTSSV